MENSIPDLPDDIVSEILAHLPVKSLLRFRCVSKTWEHSITHLINSPNSSLNTYVMIRNHWDDNPCWFCSLHSLYHEPIVDLFNHNFPAGSCYRVVGCCDGIICIATSKEDLILWNPFTKECNKLPKIPEFDEVDSSFLYYYFFGKCSKGDYKIVCLCYCSRYDEVVVFIYSQREGMWKRIDNCPLRVLNKWRFVRESKFANGKICWITKPYFEHNNDWEIGYLDVVTEVYGVLLKPTNTSLGHGYMKLGVCEAYLYVFCYDELCGGDIWRLNGDESWTKVCTIVHGGSWKCLVEYHVVEKNGKIMVMYEDEIVIFNIGDGSYRYPKFRGMSKLSFIEGSAYVPSSISPFC